MKVEINFEKLKNVVNYALSATMKSGQNNVFKGVYFETDGNTLVVRSTNIDLGFESTIPAKVDLEGKFLITGDVLSRLLSSVNVRSTDKCFVEASTGQVKFVVGKHEFSLKLLSFENFPNLPVVSGEKIEISSQVFIGALKNTVYCAAKTEIKPEISGVYVKASEGRVWFVATDAYRLAEKKIDIEDKVTEVSVIIPERNIKDILRMIDNGSENLEIVLSKNSMQIKSQDNFVVTRLIEGVFPNYTQIIPSAPVSFAVYLKEEMLKSLRLASLFSDKTQHVVLTVSENGTEIEASNQDVGSTKEKVESSLKGDGFSVKLNSKYVEEFLQNINDQSVVLKYTAENKAIIIEGVSDDSYLYLLMPSYR